jgi:hypothetical protein
LITIDLSVGTAETKLIAVGVAVAEAPTVNAALALTSLVPMVALAVTSSAPLPVFADFKLICATPLSSVRAVPDDGDSVAILPPRVKVTMVFFTTAPLLFFTVALTINELEPVTALLVTPVESVNAMVIEPELPLDVPLLESVEVVEVDPGEPPPPPQAASNIANKPQTAKTKDLPQSFSNNGFIFFLLLVFYN